MIHLQNCTKPSIPLTNRDVLKQRPDQIFKKLLSDADANSKLIKNGRFQHKTPLKTRLHHLTRKPIEKFRPISNNSCLQQLSSSKAAQDFENKKGHKTAVSETSKAVSLRPQPLLESNSLS